MIQSAAPDDYVSSGYDARGLLTSQTTNYQSIIERFYDGDGREVKRATQNYFENPTTGVGSWRAEDPIYDIRSSVLGGEVLNEVDNQGKRVKNYIRAAGALVATQTGDTANPQNQYVYFDHSDASGESSRSTNADGSAITTEGYDAAPAELDPLGNNVGLFNPYVEVLPPPTEPESPTLLPYNPFEDAMMVDGQRVNCTLDGMPIGCGQALSMLGTSADIDFGNTDPRVLSQLGIFAVYTPGKSTYGTVQEVDDGGNPGGDFKISVGTVTRHPGQWSYYFANISWKPQGQRQQPLAPLPTKKGDAIQNALKELLAFLKKGQFSEDCQKNVIDKLNGIAGFSLDKFINFLELGGDFYDGTASTASAKDYFPAYGYNATTTIADSFAKSPQTNARTANGINSKFTVFFRPDTIEDKEKTSRLTGVKISGITNDNLAFIFHEGLHGFGHNTKSNDFYDQDLQKAFGVTVGAASINISKQIKEHCF